MVVRNGLVGQEMLLGLTPGPGSTSGMPGCPWGASEAPSGSSLSLVTIRPAGSNSLGRGGMSWSSPGVERDMGLELSGVSLTGSAVGTGLERTET
jgi:hypothetical protein